MKAADWMNIWQKRGLPAILLWPLSLVFRVVIWLRKMAYRKGIFKSGRLPVTVIVVGNIFIGGTGKTPLAIWLVDILQKAGFRPGVISRGYGAKGMSPREVNPESLPSATGDEPLLIRRNANCPVVVGRNRVEAGRFLLECHPDVDVILSDDGLQHYALQRDIEIMLFDGRGAGNGWMLPAGPLREPLSRKRDFTVVNTLNFPSPHNLIYAEDLFQMRLQGDVAEKLADRSQTLALSGLAGDTGKSIAAVAGIGNPSRFFSMLRGSHLKIQEFPLPDHFDYVKNPFKAISADLILITEKDAVKCMQVEEIIGDGRIWVVPVRAVIDELLGSKIVEKCRGSGTA